MRDRFELAVSNLGRRLSKTNDRLHGRKAERWDRKTWRIVDHFAVRLIVCGER